jgi:hypothetical protein
MSHSHERKEKICLNCNARVFGPYCHVCGQHNIEPKETVLGLLIHYFNDITHFEGKFITTLRYLLFRPGFLTNEYERGRRASYMNPIRMYVFTSAFFFIVFFSLFKINEKTVDTNYKKLEAQFAESNADFNVDFVSGNITIDGINVGNINYIKGIDKNLVDSLAKIQQAKKSNNSKEKKQSKTRRSGIFNFGDSIYNSFEAYDSIQKTLPKSKRDSWLKRNLVKKSIDIDEKYGNTPGLAMARLGDVFLHKMPTIFFVSLPLFAFILMLLYIRHKKYFYVNHLMFTIHYYIFSFINLLFYFGADKLEAVTNWSVFSWLKTFLMIAVFFYLYKAIRNYYGQGRFKSILKFVTLNFLFMLLMVILFAGFIVFSAFNI